MQSETETRYDTNGVSEEHKIILDLPSEEPALGFKDYAKAFKEIIEKSEPQFAIGMV